MKDLSLKEILELAAEKFRECSEVSEEIENLDETIAEIVKINQSIKKSAEENKERAQLKKELVAMIAELNEKLETRLSTSGYRKDLFSFEIEEDDSLAWEEVRLIDRDKKTILSKSVFNFDEFESWSKDIESKIETFAYLVTEFKDRLAQEGTEVNGLYIKHRDTYHCLEVVPTSKARYVNVAERIPLEVKRGHYSSIKISEDSFVLAHGDDLFADFEYHKTDVPLEDIEDVMTEIDEIYNSIREI